ncbi:BCCT, betaine/carnitine/choline family transporter [Streptomyces atratus]|uniref:BCCT, betaine/carnitine/choline family transporter n=1 Tax=Streptomyces atratus TaxID=1893 RepID=A0A1K1YY53_STRAR|nr:BCCT, betaine/carnitine/choline family transporter [Streptomyces atratus]
MSRAAATRNGSPGREGSFLRGALRTACWSSEASVACGTAYGERNSCFRERRAVFEPLIGSRRAHGGLGRLIDILAIFATLFGSAASPGLGALQIGSGFHELHW